MKTKDVETVDDIPEALFMASAAGWQVVEFRGRLFASHPDHPFCEVVNLELKPIKLVRIEG